MKKIFKNNSDYFDFINKYKNSILVNKLIIGKNKLFYLYYDII